MALTMKAGGLSARLRDSARARYLSAGALVVISAVSVPMVSSALTPKQKVLVASENLPAGHVLTHSDFNLTDAETARSFVIPETDMSRFLGKTLRVDVPKDALLAAGDFGTFPPAGMAEVAFKVAPGSYPPDLASGERVAVVPPSPGQSATTALTGTAGTSSATTPAGAPLVGQVLSIAADPNATDGGSVVVLLVPVTSAAAVTGAQGGSLVGLDANGDVS